MTRGFAHSDPATRFRVGEGEYDESTNPSNGWRCPEQGEGYESEGITIEHRTVYRVPDENLDTLKGKIEHLNKRARRLHLRPIELRVTGQEDCPMVRLPQGGPQPVERQPGDIPTGAKIVGYRRYHFVEIDGEAPVLNGWKFVATLQHVHGEENGNGPMSVIRAVPGEEVPVQYRSADAWTCDHCHKRIQRRDTYLVRNVTTDEYKQVGSNCLKDFLGHADPHALATYAELLGIANELLEGSGAESGFGGDARFVDLQSFLSFTALAIRLDGWVSRKAVRENPNAGSATADRAEELMFPRGSTSVEDRHEPDANDITLADETLAWTATLQDQDANSLNDYLYNLRVVTASPVLERRSLGLAASAVYVYMRQQEKLAERRATQATVANSEFIGTVGEKIEVTATLTLALPIQTDFGASTLYKFVTPDGNLIVWFSSGQGTDAEIGTMLRVRGTVKRHETRDGIKQTSITRAKVTTTF